MHILVRNALDLGTGLGHFDDTICILVFLILQDEAIIFLHSDRDCFAHGDVALAVIEVSIFSLNRAH